MPAKIWNVMMRAQECRYEGRSIRRPTPIVMKTVPNQIAGRYWPVLLMKMPTMAEKKERERTYGKR